MRAARPAQWVKNLGVFLPTLAIADRITLRDVRDMALAGVVFCLAASGVYLINDACDAPLDREHPVKRLRPVASGALPARVAAGTGVALLAAVPAVAAATGPAALVLTMVGYIAVSLGYCLGLRNRPVLDLASIAVCLGLRPVAGAAAVGAGWPIRLAVATCAGAVFVAAGKRYAEARLLGAAAARVRPVLAWYRPRSLRAVWLLGAAVTVGGYATWAFGRGWAPWSVAGTALVAIAVLRYAFAVHDGGGGAPGRVLATDRVLATTVLGWVTLLVVQAYR